MKLWIWNLLIGLLGAITIILSSEQDGTILMDKPHKWKVLYISKTRITIDFIKQNLS